MVLLRDEIIMQLEHAKMLTLSYSRTSRQGAIASHEDFGINVPLPSWRNFGLVHSLDDVCSNFIIDPLNPELLSIAGMDFRVGEVYEAKQMQNFNTLAEFKRLIFTGDLQKINPDGLGKIVLEYNPFGNSIYYVTSAEQVKLPSELSLKVDGKSTTARLATMCIDRSRKIFENG